jgi:hypothetical protein
MMSRSKQIPKGIKGELNLNKDMCDGVWLVALPWSYYFLPSDGVRRPSLFIYETPVMINYILNCIIHALFLTTQ